jgi:hypothetical protein
MKNGWYIIAFVMFTFAPSAFAAELPKEGSYDYTSCFAGTSNSMPFSKTHTSSSFEIIGTNRSASPGGMFDKEAFRCVGMNASFDGKRRGNWVCEATDADGDKRLTYYSIGNDGKEIRETIVGTGKFEGMVTNGTTSEPLGPFPVIKAGTFQGCNRQTGTYKLK